jgi:hypothetical protein
VTDRLWGLALVVPLSIYPDQVMRGTAARDMLETVHEIDVRAHAHADPQRVWDVLVDVASWPAWAPFDEVSIERGHEVGEVRRVRSGRITTRERVVAFEPPHCYRYVIESGLPVNKYVAEVLLVPGADEGTDVSWHATFTSKIPGAGWVLKYLIDRTIRKGAEALVDRADTVS